MYDIIHSMSVIIRENIRGNRSFIKGIRTVCLGCMLMLGSCQTVENIGYWDQDNSDLTGEDTEPGTEPTDSGTLEPESDTPDTDSDTSEETGDTTVPSETGDTSDTGSDSDSADTETSDSASESDSDAAPYIRVPFHPDESSSPISFLVTPENNRLGLPGAWLTYVNYPANGTSTSQATMKSTHDVCLTGTVSQSSSGFYPTTFAGVGINLCPDEEYMFNWKFYSMRTCPYTQATTGIKFVGISYYVDGNLIPKELKLLLLFGPEGLLARSIDSGLDGPKDYLFESMFNITDAQTNPSDLTVIQFNVDGSFTGTVDFDFCIRDFALLIAEE
jgi:hypothetical protein